MTGTARKTAPAARTNEKSGTSRRPVQPAPGSVAPKVEAYLATLPAAQREALQRLRETVRALVPDAAEVISYGIPMFKLAGKGLVAYNATTSGCTLQAMSSAVLESHAAELADYRTGKGSIQFTPQKPLPRMLLEQVVRKRIAENERLKQK